MEQSNGFLLNRIVNCLCLIVFSILLFSCGNRKASVEETACDSVEFQAEISYPFLIDKSNKNEREIEINDIAKVSYLKLGTDTKSLIPRKWGFSGIFLTDKDLFLSFGENIYRFGLDGTFLNNIGKRGAAPFEFTLGGIFSVNEETQELFLLDVAQQRISVYTYGGKYLRSVKCEERFDRFYVLNDSLAVCSTNDITNDIRAFTISLRDGKVGHVLLEKRILANTQNLMVNIGAFSRINKLGDRIYLCVSTSDTIYAYDTKNNMVDPIYIQNPLKTDEDKVKTVPYLQFESSRFASVFIGDIPMPDFTYWVDKESGECSRVKIRNRDLDDYVLAWGTNRDNLIFDILEMPELKKRLKQGKLSGELKSLVEQSDEEDNPIIMFAEIKN